MSLKESLEKIKILFNEAKDCQAESDHHDTSFAKREAYDIACALTIVFYKERLDRFLQEYRVLAVEPELRATLYETPKYKVVLMSRPDAIIERLEDGALLQWELKTKPYINKNWIDSWEHNLQLIGQQLAVKAYAQANGLQDRLIVGAMIEALIKGKREKDALGVWRQSSPLVYVYGKRGDGIMVQDQWSPTWKKGWSKILVSDIMPLEAYILNELSPEITVTKCVQVPTISPTEYDIADAAEQWGLATIKAHEDAEICREFPHKLNEHFPQNSEMCFHYGRCWAYNLCWGSAGQAPLESGQFTVRESNHPEGELDAD